MKTPLLLTLMAGFAVPLFAQQLPPPNQGPGQNPGGPRNGQRPPPPQLIIALDANRDGVISADEIANAIAALKTLDKNGDGQLTREEFGPPPPPHRPKNSPNQDSDDQDSSSKPSGENY